MGVSKVPVRLMALALFTRMSIPVNHALMMSLQRQDATNQTQLKMSCGVLPPNLSTAFWTASPTCSSSRMSTMQGRAFPPACSTETCEQNMARQRPARQWTTHQRAPHPPEIQCWFAVSQLAPHPPEQRCRLFLVVWGEALQFWQRWQCLRHLWQLSERWLYRSLDLLQWWRACDRLSSWNKNKKKSWLTF